MAAHKNLKVMQAKGKDDRNSKLDAVVEAMVSMTMKSREKGVFLLHRNMIPCMDVGLEAQVRSHQCTKMMRYRLNVG